jgi:hypothetical protein
MRKVLSLVLVVLLSLNGFIGVFADQVIGDAVVAAIEGDQSSATIEASPDGDWNTTVSVRIKKTGNSSNASIRDNNYVYGIVFASSDDVIFLANNKNWSIDEYSDVVEFKLNGNTKQNVKYIITFLANEGQDGLQNQNLRTSTITISIISPSVTTPPTFDTATLADVYVEATSIPMDFTLNRPRVTGTGTIALTSDAPAAFPYGTTLVTWTATDANGQVANATQNVIIQDTVAPVINGGQSLPDVTKEADAVLTAVTLTEPSVTELFPDTLTNDLESGYGVGTHTVTWKATDVHGNTSTATQLVTITDTTKPVFDPLTLMDVTLEASGVMTDYVVSNPVATDIFDVEVTGDAPSTFPLGETLINWTATDANGNVEEATQKVIVKDTVAPVFTVKPADFSVKATGALTTVAIGTAEATDIFTVTMEHNAPASFAPGITTVIWTATDANGNVSTYTQKITVLYDFGGLFQPVDMGGVLNVVKAGSAIPVKFSLGGDMGLQIFENGSPQVAAYVASATATTDEIEVLSAATISGLTYDPLTKQYTYVWKTDKNLVGTTKKLVVKFKDGTSVTAYFKFK